MLLIQKVKCFREALIYLEPVTSRCHNRAATMKQTTFASLAFERKKKQTRRERFLPRWRMSCRGQHCRR